MRGHSQTQVMLEGDPAGGGEGSERFRGRIMTLSSDTPSLRFPQTSN